MEVGDVGGESGSEFGESLWRGGVCGGGEVVGVGIGRSGGGVVVVGGVATCTPS